MRARDYGIVVGDGQPGPHNAITDVPGVAVGHVTLVHGDGRLRVGHGPVRTGVTVVLPNEDVSAAPVFAGCHRLNGNGELTGLEWVRESGLLTSPVGLTNTHSVGVVRDALVEAECGAWAPADPAWSLPVVGETWDGVLNDVNGFHVRREHVAEALAAAAPGPVAEGNVGGGTGMICHGFKGGIGTASRVVDSTDGDFTVGVLVQANHGRRERLAVNGAPVGRLVPPREVPLPETLQPSGSGSIIGVVATDAPLLPHQLHRLAQRVGLGVARTGGVGEHSSGDMFLAFATGNRLSPGGKRGVPSPFTQPVTMLGDTYITAFFDAVVEATEESIVNALCAARTMTGRDGVTAHAMEGGRLAGLLDDFGLRQLPPLAR